MGPDSLLYNSCRQDVYGSYMFFVRPVTAWTPWRCIRTTPLSVVGERLRKFSGPECIVAEMTGEASAELAVGTCDRVRPINITLRSLFRTLAIVTSILLLKTARIL